MEHPRRREAARGFTLVELLIVVSLGSVIMASAFQLLISQQQMYTVVSARVDALNSIRAASDILFNQLREVSPSQGDIVYLDSDSITVRSASAFGVVCGVDLGNSKLTVMSVVGTFTISDSISFMADNDPLAGSDDVYKTGAISAVQDATCSSGDTAQVVTVSGTFGSPPDSVLEGSPVRAYESYTFGSFAWEGQYYLGRRSGSDSAAILAGPLSSSSGIKFEYEDSSGATVASGEDVALIRVTLLTAVSVISSQGRDVQDSTVIEIQTRNE